MALPPFAFILPMPQWQAPSIFMLSPKLRRRRSLPQQEFARCTLDHRRSASLTAREAGFAG
jgi:hypothetical protein